MSMQTVITQSQGRAILNGRKPNVPVQYETAVKMLAECLTLDEAKLWDAKSDALAAWAKIYRDDEVTRKAKALKLHAYRRMGQLAAELRPHKVTEKGRSPGPFSLLLESGMSRTAAESATALGRMSKRDFAKAINNPKAPITIVRITNAANPDYTRFTHSAQNLRSITRQHTAAQMAAIVKALSVGEKDTAKRLCADISEWLDDLHARLK
jgi:hypothetical protein